MNDTLISHAEDVVSRLCRLHDDLTQSAMDAYLGHQKDRFKAFDDLKDQIGSEAHRVREIAKLIKAVESGETTAPVIRIEGQPIPKESYRRAFIESLRDLGGMGKVSQIMDSVESKMSALFTDLDRRCDLPSDPNRPRWRSQVYGLIQVLLQEQVIASVTKGT